MHQVPEAFGQPQSRWSLKGLLQSCEWLRLHSESGLWRLLDRLKISYKRARDYLHSPDREYREKVAYLQQCLQQTLDAPERYVLVYLDEFGFERQPSLSWAYSQRGSNFPLARRSCRSNTQCRGIGALNALTGQLTYEQHSKITLPRLSHFYHHLVDDYSWAECIFVVQDNWPVHVHPDVLARLQPQHSPFWPSPPANWPTQPRPRAVRDTLPIQLIFLPTYSPWLNPIEQLWRWVRHDVLHLHRFSDDWLALKQRVHDFMARFATPSLDLLNYVGLLPS
ncbi:MAG: IS630 family transposase [Anaerolineae bacterium]|nr:IS630 family transposase [Anaerolineae bacterium]